MPTGRYEILEISLADTHRLYEYLLQGIPHAQFSLKGFEYPWILTSHSWREGETVLDVGAGYSLLPIHIQRTYGCDVWVADDFGMQSGKPFWTRRNIPGEHIAGHPEVRFVLERLGDQTISTLPIEHFDVVCSSSALEHVPSSHTRLVWQHMDKLLKPGGEMLHAIDLGFPSNGGMRQLCLSLAFDKFYRLFPKGQRTAHSMATPRAYANAVFEALGIGGELGRDLSVLRMVLDPEVLSENHSIGFNRIIKDGMTNYRYRRVGALLLRLRKI